VWESNKLLLSSFVVGALPVVHYRSSALIEHHTPFRLYTEFIEWHPSLDLDRINERQLDVKLTTRSTGSTDPLLLDESVDAQTCGIKSTWPSTMWVALLLKPRYSADQVVKACIMGRMVGVWT
jgi:hypothetical protein